MDAKRQVLGCPGCGVPMRAVRYRIDPRTAGTNPHAAPCGHPLDGRTVTRAYASGLHIEMPTVDGAALVAAERDRQVSDEGHSLEADLAHAPGALAWAAWCYLDRAAPDADRRSDDVPRMWPLPAARWNPERRPLRLLIIAGALIAAEIDRRLARGETP